MSLLLKQNPRSSRQNLLATCLPPAPTCLTSDNALGVKLRLAAIESHPRIPSPTARCSLPLGWTDRVPLRPDLVCSDARYGDYAGSPPRSRACDRPCNPTRHGVALSPSVLSALRGPPDHMGTPRGRRQAHDTPGTRLPARPFSCCPCPSQGGWRSPTARENAGS